MLDMLMRLLRLDKALCVVCNRPSQQWVIIPRQTCRTKSDSIQVIDSMARVNICLSCAEYSQSIRLQVYIDIS
jgi:hypothetical protein